MSIRVSRSVRTYYKYMFIWACLCGIERSGDEVGWIAWRNKGQVFSSSSWLFLHVSYINVWVCVCVCVCLRSDSCNIIRISIIFPLELDLIQIYSKSYRNPIMHNTCLYLCMFDFCLLVDYVLCFLFALIKAYPTPNELVCVRCTDVRWASEFLV